MLYRVRLGLLISQAFNALVMGGDPDESFSARCYRMSWLSQKWLIRRNKVDRLFGVDHCQKVYLAAKKRQQFQI